VWVFHYSQSLCKLWCLVSYRNYAASQSQDVNTGMTMYTYPNAPYLLPNWPTSGKWDCTDTEQLYQLNLTRRPPGWDWQDQPVEYTWNSNGYRAPEWEHVAWSTSHVVMGCSYVLGVGVNDADTLASQMERELREPVINLGMGGTGPMAIMYNTLRMQDMDWRPKSVTIIIPELTRLTYFDQNSVDNLIPWKVQSQRNTGILYMYEKWLTPPNHADIYGTSLLRGAEAVWLSRGVPVILRHWTPTTGPGRLAASLSPLVDCARDMMPTADGEWFSHAGPKSLSNWAKEIVMSIRAL